MKNVLATGRPGIGKTSVVETVARSRIGLADSPRARSVSFQRSTAGSGERLRRETRREIELVLACGLNTSRDHAAALEILRLGLSLQAVSTVSNTC